MPQLTLSCVTVTILALSLISFVMPVQNAFAATTIAWVPFGTHYLGDGGVGAPGNIIQVVDPTKAGSGTVTVQVTSTHQSSPTVLTLNEGPLGTFTDTNIIFSENVREIPIGTTVTISISDAAGNVNSTAVDTIPVNIVSTSNPVGITPRFSETGVNTALFVGKVTFGPNPTSAPDNYVHVANGDEISILDVHSGLTTNAIITPNPDPSVGDIFAKINDTVTATYGSISANITIGDDTCHIRCGGGGGGLIIHPGLVLDLILNIIGGSPYIVTPPSFGGGDLHYSDGLTIVQNGAKTTYDISSYNQEIQDQVLVTGKPVNMTFKMYDSYNINAIIHSGLYIIPRGSDMITPNSIASIVYDKGSKIEINDPSKLFANASVSSSNDGKFQYMNFLFVPTRSYEKMSFLDRSWNDHLYSTDVRVHDAAIPTPKPEIIPAGLTKYDDFHKLYEMIEKDGFKKPQIMAHIHDTTDVFPSNEGGHVYWLVDSINHTVTMVISDKDENTLFSFVQPLIPNEIQPQGDYGFMKFTEKQFNRCNSDEEQKIMNQEAIKAIEKKMMD